MMGRMKTIMNLGNLTTVDQLAAFLSGTQAVVVSVFSDEYDRYLCMMNFNHIASVSWIDLRETQERTRHYGVIVCLVTWRNDGLSCPIKVTKQPQNMVLSPT